MIKRDDVESALREFRKHKLRSSLTVLAIAVSVASIVVLVSVADAMLRDKMQYFEESGAKMSEIVLLDQRGIDQFGGVEEIKKRTRVMFGVERLDYQPIKDWHDADLIKLAANGKIKAISPFSQTSDGIKMVSGNMDGSAKVYGVSHEFFDVIAPDLVVGRPFTREEVEEGKNVVIPSWVIQREYLACEFSGTSEADYDQMDAMYGESETNYEGTPKPLVEDDSVVFRLQSTEFEVLGLTPADFPVIERFFRWNWCMFTPITTMRSLTGVESTNRFLFYPESNAQEAFDEIAPTLAQLYPNATPVLRSAEEWAAQERNTLGAATTGFIVIGLGTLLVSVIVIMNTMLVSVRQRRLEVGLRKALGANRQDIARQFRNETLVLCFLGILVGLGFSLFMGVVVEKSQHAILMPLMELFYGEGDQGAGGYSMNGRGWQISHTTIALVGILASIVTAIAAFGASLLPARAASKLDPVACLRNTDLDETKNFRKLPGFMRGKWMRPFTEDPERSWLAISAIAMGVAVVIVLTSVGEHGRRRAMAFAQFLRADQVNFFVFQQVREEGFPKMDLEFLRRIPEECPHVTNLVSFSGTDQEGRDKMTIRTESLSLAGNGDFQKHRIFGAVGVMGTFGEVMPDVKMVSGEMITTEDVDQKNPVAAFPDTISDRLFPNGDALGGTVEVNGISFTVKGIWKQSNAVVDSEDQGGQVYIPWSFAREVFGEEGGQFVRARTTDTELASTEMVGFYERHYGKTFENKENLTNNPGERLQQAKTRSWFEAALVMLLGMGTLVVGGIGMMNTMLISTTSRINEIGVQRALGASRWRIVRQFLFESAVLSVGGGLVGIVVGVVFAQYGLPMLYLVWDQDKLWPTALSLHWPLIALACAVVVGMLSALGPALKASFIRPADALRYE